MDWPSDVIEKALKDVQAKLGKMEQTVTLKALPPIADPARRYMVQLTPNNVHDDSVRLTVTDGLLNSSTSESTGQAAAIIVNLVSAIAGAKSGASPMFNTIRKSIPPPKEPPECKPFAFRRVFDLTASDEITLVGSQFEIDG